jgi:hypothetical protein
VLIAEDDPVDRVPLGEPPPRQRPSHRERRAVGARVAAADRDVRS